MTHDSQPRLLIVDDEAAQMKALCNTLEQEGFCTTGRSSAIEALACLREQKFEIVITDLMMPGMDGIAFLRAALDLDSSLVGIVMTGHGAIDTAVAAMKAGALDYILKPFKLSAILPVLARALSVRRLRTENIELHKAVVQRNAELENARNELSSLNAKLEEKVGNLRANEQRLRDITSTVGEGVFVLDREGCLTFLNPEGERLLGWGEAELLGRNLHEMVHFRHEDGTPRPESECESTEALRSQRPCRVEDDVFVCKGGALLPVSYVTTPIVHDGSVIGAVTAFQDVSNRREFDRMRDEFVSTVSHELRTPLASLRGFAELMLTRPFSEEKRREFLGIIHRESIRLTGLINDFLDIQRIESGRQVYHFERGALLPRLQDAAALFGQPTSKHRLVLEVPAELPSVRIDLDRIGQVIANLISNAMKFSPDGTEVRLGARCEEATVVVSVADHGFGIPAAALPKLFTKFYRVDDGPSRAVRGSGLGLALVKQIVEAHGGRVWVESSPGSGSTFYFSVPVADPPPSLDHGNENCIHIADIVIVEDDEAYSRLLSTHLEGLGWRVAHTRFGETAADLVRRTGAHLVLLDLHLAGALTGWDVLIALKSDPNLQTIPILVISVTEANLRGLALEGAEYVPKTATHSQLLQAIQRRLPSLSGKSILLVDNDENYRRQLRELLETNQAGLELEEACDGREAIEHLGRHMPDLLILDFLMPELDGFEVLRRLRTNRAAVQLHVVMLTAKELAAREREYLTRRMASMVSRRSASLDYISNVVAQTLGWSPPRNSEPAPVEA